jgi:exodeoxyribonuclease VII large subunit
VPVRSELIAATGELATRLDGATLRGLESRRRELRAAARALPRAEDLFAIARRSFDEQAARLVRALSANVFAHRAAWQKLAARFGAGRPERVIERSAERLRGLSGRQQIALAVHAERKRAAFSLVARRLRPEPVATRLDACRRQVADLLARGGRAAERAVERRAHRLAALDQLLRSLSYASIVARGYAVIRDAAGAPLASAAAVMPGASLDIEFRDGHVPVTASGEPAKPPPAPKRRRPAEPDQESLF